MAHSPAGFPIKLEESAKCVSHPTLIFFMNNEHSRVGLQLVTLNKYLTMFATTEFAAAAFAAAAFATAAFTAAEFEAAAFAGAPI